MKSLNIKQRLILGLVRITEILVNSSFLIPVFNVLERLVYGNIRDKPRQKGNSMFCGLRVAFIADGNRRYYKKMTKKGIGEITCEDDQKTSYGADRILQIIKFAYIHKMAEVSFYCFSIKNFSRKKEEVDTIMNYIRKRKELESDVPFRIKVYGKLELLDEDVAEQLVKWVKATENNTGLVVNIFFAYTSSAEDGHERAFKGSVDLVVRTSGVRRLSDFMVYQVARGAAIDFVKPLWPEYSNIHLYLTLYKFWLEEKYINTSVS